MHIHGIKPTHEAEDARRNMMHRFLPLCNAYNASLNHERPYLDMQLTLAMFVVDCSAGREPVHALVTVTKPDSRRGRD